MKNNVLKGLLVIFATVFTGFAQAQTVSGKVSDASGPLPSASVVVKGTTTSTQTDLEGKYTIKAGADATLVFSFIGLKTQAVSVAGKSTINVTLQSDDQQLKDVVVIGYGSVKKKDATGAIDQISSKKFDNIAATSPADILKGKVAGVQVTSASGEPGAGAAIRIRGNSSIRSGNNPLIVVDGVQLDGGDSSAGGVSGLGSSSARNPLNFINQNDIESMTILKDASSTAIYGSRGANGVIMITTKRSKSKTPQLSFNSSVGFSTYKSKFEDMMTSSQYLANGGTNKGGSYNWKDAILQSGYTINNDFAYSTGNENSNTRFSFGASNTDGIVKNTGMDKYTASLNNTTEFFNGFMKLDANVLISGIKDKATLTTNNAGYVGNVIGAALYWNPTSNTINPNGTYNDIGTPGGDDYLNPQHLLDAYSDYTNTNKLIGSISTTLKLTSRLKYKLFFGIDGSMSSRKSQLLPSIKIKDVAQATVGGTVYFGQADILNINKFNKSVSHTLTYDSKINDNINMILIGGFEYNDYNFNGNFSEARGFDPAQVNLVDNISGGVGFNPGSAGANNTWGPRSVRTEVELQSYFGKASFDLYKKFNLDATIRRDGSSKLGANNKYENFYSLGAAYKIVDNKDGLVNDLKLRGTYGITGNQEFAANSALNYASYNSPGNGFYTQINANPNLKWETTTSTGLGIDFTLFKNKLSGSLDYYNRSTKDLIGLKPAESTGPSAGGASRYINLPGTLKNNGFEISLNYKVINTEDLTWDVSANAAFLKNKLEDFPLFLTTAELNGQGLSGAFAQVLTNNYPAYTYYIYEFRGYDSTGASIYADAAGNNTSLGTASKSLLDKTPLPTMTLGFSSSVSYKNFDASVSFYGSYGHYLYNNTANALFFKGAFPVRNIPLSVATSSQAGGDPNTPSTKYLEKGDFLRMGNLTFGYTLRGGALEKAKIKSARFYVNGQNLLLFTDYTGFDPEVDINKSINGVPSAGIDYLSYPKSKTYTFGVNLTF
jgi:TonB-dependent starch-binding outer membrane protein SusC